MRHSAVVDDVSGPAPAQTESGAAGRSAVVAPTPSVCYGGRFSLLAVCVLLLGGCAAPVRTVRPTVDPRSLGETGFIHYLAATSVVTVDEGARAVLSLVGDEAARGDADRRWQALVDRGAANPRWGVAPDTVLDRGTFAFMLCRVLNVPLGLNDSLAAATRFAERRAAARTAEFQQLMEYGPAHDPITGQEVVSTLASAEQWQTRNAPTHAPTNNGYP